MTDHVPPVVSLAAARRRLRGPYAAAPLCCRCGQTPVTKPGMCGPCFSTSMRELIDVRTFRERRRIAEANVAVDPCSCSACAKPVDLLAGFAFDEDGRVCCVVCT